MRRLRSRRGDRADAGVIYKQEQHQAQLAQIASFEVDNRAKFTKARDEFSGNPDGFQKWADNTTSGALAEVPGWMQTHAKQFLSRETDGKYAAVLGEKRHQDKQLDSQALVARTKMADDDVMSIASATGSLNSPEGKAAVATYQGVLDSSVSLGLIPREQAQLLTEDLTTRSQGAIIRKSVEGVYREQGYEAAREHLSKTIDELGAPYRITDKIRTQTLGWLRSEEAGMRGERTAIAQEWAAAKGNIATLDPAVVQDIQHRAYSVGAYKVGDDIQASTSALGIVKTIRQLPQADQIRIMATGNLDARLAQSESGGKPDVMNKLGYVGTYQFGAPRLKDLGVYTPGDGENMAAWSKTPATATGKWSGTFNIPGFPDVKTVEDFKANPDAQKAVYGLHQQRTEKEIDDLGLGQYVGQTIGGVQITRDGLRAMIHLGGAEWDAGNSRIRRRRQPGRRERHHAARLRAHGRSIGYARLADGLARRPDGARHAQEGHDAGSRQEDHGPATAIGKTEFPPMDEIGALGAQVHLLGNEEQKRQVAEMAAQAEYGKKFVSLPQAQRDELVTRWREKMKVGATITSATWPTRCRPRTPRSPRRGRKTPTTRPRATWRARRHCPQSTGAARPCAAGAPPRSRSRTRSARIRACPRSRCCGRARRSRSPHAGQRRPAAGQRGDPHAGRHAAA
jgi:hypothetical protein